MTTTRAELSMHPEHYHQLDRPGSLVTVRLGDEILGRSDRTILLKEVGKRVHDPVYYFPPDDVNRDSLAHSGTSTRCPIKGEASYWTYEGRQGVEQDLAWSYEDPIEYSAPIRGYLAFDARRVTIEIAPKAR